MGRLWDNFKADLADGAKAALRNPLNSEAARHEALERQAERRMLEAAHNSRAALQQLILGKQQEYDIVVARQRELGNNVPRAVILRDGTFDGQRAIVRYQMNGQQGRMEIFYGGAGGDPLNTPAYDYHGHVVAVDGVIVSWLLPGSQNHRVRVV